MKINPSTHQEIIRIYRDEYTPMIDIARQYGVTRQNIFYILRRYAVDTSKAGAGNVRCKCYYCGKEIKKCRKYFTRRRAVYCAASCYYAALKGDPQKPYIYDRQGQKRSREVVARHFHLGDGHIVHHIDRDESNAYIGNILVFACSADHLRFHRGFDIKPIFDGRVVARSLERQSRPWYLLKLRTALVVDYQRLPNSTIISVCAASTPQEATEGFIKAGYLRQAQDHCYGDPHA